MFRSLYLVCQDLVSCYYSFVLLPLGVNGSVCFVCCVSDSVCELFGETIRNIFGRAFVVECYGVV